MILWRVDYIERSDGPVLTNHLSYGRVNSQREACVRAKLVARGESVYFEVQDDRGNVHGTICVEDGEAVFDIKWGEGSLAMELK